MVPLDRAMTSGLAAFLNAKFLLAAITHLRHLYSRPCRILALIVAFVIAASL